jgi:hypothetical protein
VQEGSIGLILKNGKYEKKVSPGMYLINSQTEILIQLNQSYEVRTPLNQSLIYLLVYRTASHYYPNSGQCSSGREGLSFLSGDLARTCGIQIK